MEAEYCNPMLPGNAQLGELDFKSLFDNMKSTIWMVKPGIKMYDEEIGAGMIGTGICISPKGHILTSSCYLHNTADIMVRGIHSEKFVKATRVDFEGDHGLALLKVKVRQKSKFANILDEDQEWITCQPVYTIRNIPGHNTFSLLRGYLASGLIKKWHVSLVDDVMREMVCKLKDVDLLCITGFWSHGYALCCGPPVLNAQGKIIAVIVANENGYDYAIPLFRLKDEIERACSKIK